MKRSLPAPSSDRGGFVLVGVVMFVLALTILGLSLFALSGYEAQFINESYDSGQALYTAQSGIEHAKFVLSHRRRLADVGESLYPSNVVYARACYWDSLGKGDSTSIIDNLPADAAIEIRVLASVQGERRMLQTNVIPTQTPEVYKRLMSVTDSVYAGGPGDGWNAYQTGPRTWLIGDVYEGGKSNSNWWNAVHYSGTPAGSPPTITHGLPLPNVQGFFDRFLDDPATLTAARPDTFWNAATDGSLILNGAGPGTVTYFKSETDPFGDPQWSFRVPQFSDHKPGKLVVHVHGWVVWMLPHGLRFDSRVEIQGSTSDCLVIVTGPAIQNLQGMRFGSAIGSVKVPVILVSNGWIVDTHANWDQWYVGETVSYLSIFARCARIQGPIDYTDNAGQNTYLNHQQSDSNDRAGNLIDQLCRLGALPNSDSGGIAFKPVRGTWVELDPDQPDKPPN